MGVPAFSFPAYAFVALGFLISALVLWLLLRTGWAWKIATDVPNHRSLHVRATPRVGGWGIVAACVCITWAALPSYRSWALMLLILGIVSQIDDRGHVRASVRFAVQAGCALFAVLSHGAIGSLPLLAVSLLTIVWMTNLFNFMDGANGLAGSMAVVGFAAFAIAAPASSSLGTASAVVAAAAAGFLPFNFPRARVFMGDAGSVPLGFAAATLGLYGWLDGAWPWWFAPLVFSPFICDASVTLARRLLRRQRFWEAHREHYYQRMIQMRQSHLPVVLRWQALMVVNAGISLVLLRAMHATVMIVALLWLAFLAILGWRVDRRWQSLPRTP